MGSGFLLLYKRFESGSLSWPRTTEEAADLTEEQYHYLMLGLNTKPHSKAVEKFKPQMKKLTCRSRGVSNRYKVQKLNQLIRGWVNYFKIGSMKSLCQQLDGQIRYRLRICIWKHWKTPKNRAKNLMKLDVPTRSAWKTAYLEGYAKPAHCGDVHIAISNKRLADFGLISMM